MDHRPPSEGITLQSRTLSHWLVVRKVADLVADEPRLHSLRREWLVELSRAQLPKVWNALLQALRRAAPNGAGSTAPAATAASAADWSLLLLEDRQDEINAVLSREPGGPRDVARLQVASNAVSAWLYGEPERCAATAALLEAAIGAVAKVGQPDLVAVRFWHQSNDGAADMLRRVQCPRFAEIAANYPSCGAELARLMALESPWERGRLVFWHGPPGTGKTWALRALVREWGQMSPEVITDPDAFFASNAYLQQVLLAEPPTLGWNEGTALRAQDRPRLFVLEDAPQLVLQESRATQGARIGNLLSMTDGILGQGLRAIFLITTNEKVHRVDPAIRRPGRCLQELELPNFTAEQARAWLAAKQVAASPAADAEIEPGAELSLAELYERLHRGAPERPRARVERMGFLPNER
ncbi:MAG: ATP-binding protein [Planctomycetes bacterium]|nr:ATP-binding protein [Planctomycetota bacterium]